jgi:hypothetical protein
MSLKNNLIRGGNNLIRGGIILLANFGFGGLPAMAGGEFERYPLPPNQLVFNTQRPSSGRLPFDIILQECTGVGRPVCAVTTPSGRKLTASEKRKIRSANGKVYSYTPPNGLRGGYSVVGPDNAKGDKPKVNKPKVNKPKVNKPKVNKPKVNKPKVNKSNKKK